MQNDGKLASDGDARLVQAPAFCDAHAPGFERRSSRNPRKQHIGRLVQIASQHRVAAFGDAPRPIGFARRVSPRRQADIGSNTA